MWDEYTITTYDNPWNPYTHYREWLKEDFRLGYNTPALVANWTLDTDEMSQSMIDWEMKRVNDEILEKFPLLYKKIYKDPAKNK